MIEDIKILSNMVKQRKQSIIQYEEGAIELERERQEINDEEFYQSANEQEIREEVSKIIESKTN